MTSGERLIWAAAFAKHYDISSPGKVVEDNARWRQWEELRTVQAIECAGGAVERCRESLADVRTGFGEDSETYKMLADILAD